MVVSGRPLRFLIHHAHLIGLLQLSGFEHCVVSRVNKKREKLTRRGTTDTRKQQQIVTRARQLVPRLYIGLKCLADESYHYLINLHVGSVVGFGGVGIVNPQERVIFHGALEDLPCDISKFQKKKIGT